MTDNLDTSMIPLDKPGVRWKSSRFDQDAKWVWTPGLMTHYERSVYQFLNIRGGNDRKIFCSQQDIAEYVGFSESTVKRAIAGLKEKGLISYAKIKTTANQKYPSNSYTLYVPAEFAEDLHQDYLEKVSGKSEAEGKKSTKSAPERGTDEIDTSCLEVPGWESFEAFQVAYKALPLPEGERCIFPKTWTEAREVHYMEKPRHLNWLVQSMQIQMEEHGA